MAHFITRPRTVSVGAVVQQLIDSDQTEDEDFVDALIEDVSSHPEWVRGVIDPTSVEFNLHAARELSLYRDDTSPVVVSDGFVIDGSHRASAAFHFGQPLFAFVPKPEVEGAE